MDLQSPLQMLRAGMDTVDIAKAWGCSEAIICELILEARHRERSQNPPEKLQDRQEDRKAGEDNKR